MELKVRTTKPIISKGRSASVSVKEEVKPVPMVCQLCGDRSFGVKFTSTVWACDECRNMYEEGYVKFENGVSLWKEDAGYVVRRLVTETLEDIIKTSLIIESAIKEAI